MSSTLFSMSPSTGSSSGTLIMVSGTGFGINTKNLNLVVESTGESICETVTPLGYGSFSC